MSETTTDLLRSLESDHHRGRVAAMIALGRRSSTDALVARQLEQLSHQGFYERQLALFGFLGAQDGESLARVARLDLSQRLRYRAIKGLSYLGRDSQVLGLLADLPRQARQKLLRQLQRRGRQDVVDGWLSSQADPPIDSLAYASPAVLDRHQARLLERGGQVEWKRLTRRQPDWTVQTFLQGQRDEVAIARVRTVLLTLAKVRSPLCWTAWRRAVEAGYEKHQLPERELFLVCAPQAADWALAEANKEEGFAGPEVPDWPFQSRARCYPFAVSQKLVDLGWMALEYQWWSRLAKSERLLLWNDFRYSVIWTDGRINAQWLKRLDAATRVQEARPQSRLGVIELEPNQLVDFLAMLGKDEGWEALRPFLTSPDVDTRAAGVRGLVQLAKYQPDCLDAVLPDLVARRNEADPVRAAFLDELSKLRPSHWKSDHLGPLEDILQALMSAADASAASFAAAESLLLRSLPHHGQWAVVWLGRVLRHWGKPSLASWAIPLQRPGSAEILEDQLEQTLAEWIPRERYGAIFSLFSSLGKALRRLSRVRARCVALCGSSQSEIASQAWRSLFLNAASQTRPLIPALIADDPSWIGEIGVLDWLNQRRQDLLTPYLEGQVVAGKFASGRTEWVLWPSQGFWRWTPRQQANYAQQLAGLLGDSQRDFLALRRCVRSLALLTDVAPSILERAASLAETRQAVRDEAIRCLARVEDGRGLPALTAALEDERARIAIYALRSSLLQMPAAEALQRLTSIDSPKVTVAKEVARLLGDLPHGLGVSVLLERLSGDLHRDVRLAALRGLWDHLDNDLVWPPFWDAAQSPDPAIGRALSAVTSPHLGRPARKKLERLLVVLLSHPSRLVRWQVLDRLAKAPLSAEDSELIQACRGFLAEPREGLVAAGALLRTLLPHPAAWASLLKDTVADRESLAKLVNTVSYHRNSSERQVTYPQVVEATLECLACEPELVALRLELIATVRPLEVFLTAVETQFEGDSESGLEILFSWSLLLVRLHYRMDQATYSRIADRWKEHARPILRRLCLEALLVHAKAFGWTPFNRQQLHEFTLDPSALVRAKSQFTFPPPQH
jgi:hypothetical protein